MISPKGIIVYLMLLSLSANAQKHLLGIKLGLNNSNVTDKKTFNNKIDKRGFLGGITYEYILKRRFTFGADVLYSQKGFGNYYVLGDALNNPNEIGGERLFYFQYDYISIPIILSYSVGSKLFLFTSIGLAPSFLVSAKHYEDKQESKAIYNTNLNTFEISGQAELGVGIKFKKKMNFYFSFSKFQGFNKLTNDSYFAFSEITNLGYNVSLAMKYRIDKKVKKAVE